MTTVVILTSLNSLSYKIKDFFRKNSVTQNCQMNAKLNLVGEYLEFIGIAVFDGDKFVEEKVRVWILEHFEQIHLCMVFYNKKYNEWRDKHQDSVDIPQWYRELEAYTEDLKEGDARLQSIVASARNEYFK